jgi:hypothetical protein
MTNATSPTTGPQLRAAYVNLYANGTAVQIDGVNRGCEILDNGTVRWTGAPHVEDREEWQACHPGVAPTSANLLAVYADVADEVVEQWDAMLADLRAEDFDDAGCDWNGRAL